MDNFSTKYAYHLFVCTNARPVAGRPSCAGGGGEAVFAALTTAVAADSSLAGRVAITPCGCLGPCFDGPNLVIYPEGTWYAGVTLADVDDLVEQHLRRGRPLHRLVYPWDGPDRPES